MSDLNTAGEKTRQEQELELELAQQFDWIPETMDEVFRDLNAFYVIEEKNIQWHRQEKVS